MFAAICAKRAGAEVILLEHTDRVGKKILATGNGKCNLTNLSIQPGDYRGNHPSFVVPVLKRFSQKDTLQFFEEMGLVWKDVNGLVYPYSNQASTVLDLLRMELNKLAVIVKTEIEVTEIIPQNKNSDKTAFLLKTNQGELLADKVILACGSKAAPQTGSDGSGYKLAGELGHLVVTPLPALVQLKAEGNYFKRIAGVRSDCNLRLYIEESTKETGNPAVKTLVTEEFGEVQFTDYGISGIPVFQLSRFAVKALWEKKKTYVVCDFLPNLTTEEMKEYLHKKQKNLAAFGTCEELLLGLVNKKLIQMVLSECGISLSKSADELSDKQLKKIASLLKNWQIILKGYNSFDKGQICQGGVDTEQLSETLESKIHKGLYFAGEMIDIDGKCGGFNLQWAWSSAYVAATNAAKE